MSSVMVIDGNSILNRAYFGIRALNAPDGTPTNAVYGFLSIVQRVYEQYKPEGICVCFDVHAPTFRHEMYDGYKAQRKPMPDDLKAQLPVIREVLDRMGVPRYELAGWEADDLLGTIARRCEEAGIGCYLVTGDKDSLQLVTDRTHVLLIKTRMGNTETTEYTPEVFEAEYGFDPLKMVDLKSLMGDASDNIPGVPGIGEKGALELLHSFGSLAGVYEHLEDPAIKPAKQNKLREGRASAELSYTLATISREAPLDFQPEAQAWTLSPSRELYELFRRLNFRRWIEKWRLAEYPECVKGTGSSTHSQTCQGDGFLDTLPCFPEIKISAAEALERLRAAEAVSVVPLEGLDSLELCDGQAVFTVRWAGNTGMETDLFTAMDAAVALNQADEPQRDDYTQLLRELFSPKISKITQNAKDLMRLCLEEGLSEEGFVFDTALAAYLLDCLASDYGVARLAEKYLPDADPEHPLSPAAALYALRPVLDAKLSEQNLSELYYQVELPLCPVLARMERRGFRIDKQALYEFGEGLKSKIADLQQEIWSLAGEEFNINSPKQLGHILFEVLMLPAGKKTKTGWSTNADVLDHLRGKHPIVQDVLDYRELSKLKSTYADGLLKVIDSDGRVRTDFKMTVTATGRLSSAEPNLQNIPVRRESGAAIRRMFIAGPGNMLVDADYSQIELRLLAHIAGDETMQEDFRAGRDVHRATAGYVFQVPPEEVTPQMRSYAKAVNFGIVYGISAFSLADDIGVSRAEAARYIQSYLDKYSGVKEYMERVIREAKEQGFAETLYHRRRALPELAPGAPFNTRSFGERVARNMPIQGTAADVMKIAMIRADAALREKLPSAHLILQVHDELIVECPEADAEAAKAILTEAMEGAAELSLPLTAEAGAGKSWADAH